MAESLEDVLSRMERSSVDAKPDALVRTSWVLTLRSAVVLLATEVRELRQRLDRLERGGQPPPT